MKRGFLDRQAITWYLVRHGETASNLRQVYAGRSEEGLNPNGRRQAVEAAKKLTSLNISALYCSPLTRAMETAEIIGKALDREPILDESFGELRLGIWEGKSEEEIAREFPEEWHTWKTRPAEINLEGRETLGELLSRVLQGIAGIKNQFRGSDIVVVTHVAIIRVLLLHSQKRDLNLYPTIPIPNGDIFALENL